MPLRSKIVSYWKDKYILESGEICLFDDYSFEKCEPVVIDIGEPHCFGCGEFIEDVILRNDYDELLNTDPLSLWDVPQSRELSRCHIVPCSLGGGKSRDNLFLLCSDCHRESPDTIFPQAFFRWVFDRRRKGPKLVSAIRRAAKSLSKNVDLDSCCNISVDWNNFVSDHQGYIKENSLFAAITSFYLEAAE